MRTVAQFVLLLLLVCGAGCSGTPTSELVLWSVDGPPTTVTGEGDGPKFVPVSVKLRATGTALYRKNSQGEYELSCEDFVITGPNGATAKGMGFRNSKGSDVVTSAALRDKPSKMEELIVIFAVPEAFASRSDLVLTCRGIPAIPLDPAKKK